MIVRTQRSLRSSTRASATPWTTVPATAWASTRRRPKRLGPPYRRAECCDAGTGRAVAPAAAARPRLTTDVGGARPLHQASNIAGGGERLSNTLFASTKYDTQVCSHLVLQRVALPVKRANITRPLAIEESDHRHSRSRGICDSPMSLSEAVSHACPVSLVTE